MPCSGVAPWPLPPAAPWVDDLVTTRLMCNRHLDGHKNSWITWAKHCIFYLKASLSNAGYYCRFPDMYQNNPSSRNSPNPIKPCSSLPSLHSSSIPPPPHVPLLSGISQFTTRNNSYWLYSHLYHLYQSNSLSGYLYIYIYILCLITSSTTVTSLWKNMSGKLCLFSTNLYLSVPFVNIQYFLSE